MTSAFRQLRLLLAVLFGLLVATMGSQAVASGYDGENGCDVAANNVAVRQHYLKTLEGIPGKIDGSMRTGASSLPASECGSGRSPSDDD
jgi:hypothetical protein